MRGLSITQTSSPTLSRSRSQRFQARHSTRISPSSFLCEYLWAPPLPPPPSPSSPIRSNQLTPTFLDQSYLDTFSGLPVNRADGTKLDYQQVVKHTNADLIATVMSSRGESLVFSVNVVKESYGIALAWMKDLLWGSVFSVER